MGQPGTAMVKNEGRDYERLGQRLWRRTQWTGNGGGGGSERPLAIGNRRS